MGSLTTSAIEKVLKHLVGKENFTVNPYLGLFTTKPTESSAGVEVSSQGTGYSRVSVSNQNDWVYDSADLLIKNNTDILFNMATLDWGTIVAVGLFNSLTGGELLWYSSLSVPVVIKTANTLSIKSNTLSLEFIESSSFSDSFYFDTSSSYELEYDTSVAQVEKSFDTSMGYKDVGALRVSMTNNIAEGPLTLKLFRDSFVSANSSQAYTISAVARTTNIKILPKLIVQCFNSVGNITLVVQETVSTQGSNPVLLDKWQTRTISFITDIETTSIRVGFYIESTEAGQTGTVWIDDLRVAPTS